jgi:hypothetical protein
MCRYNTGRGGDGKGGKGERMRRKRCGEKEERMADKTRIVRGGRQKGKCGKEMGRKEECRKGRCGRRECEEDKVGWKKE